MRAFVPCCLRCVGVWLNLQLCQKDVRRCVEIRQFMAPFSRWLRRDSVNSPETMHRVPCSL